MAERHYEAFMVLFLDAQNRVIAPEEMSRGTLTQTSVYPREVVKRALALNAAAVILAHNHPSGVAEPIRIGIPRSGSSPQRGCASPHGGGPSPQFLWSLTMKSGRTLVDLARELERQISSKRDLVVPSSFLQCRTEARRGPVPRWR
jgi:hypothetical protein